MKIILPQPVAGLKILAGAWGERGLAPDRCSIAKIMAPKFVLASAKPTLSSENQSFGAPIFAFSQMHLKIKTLRGAAPVENPRQGNDSPAPAIF
ncbi:MAG: hypothetical protein LBI62_09315 [Candidatus Accumulibacter sp.]|jgi:hypothetical protein|nr:hypothetical protein [Accumulibacter sp.]